MEALGAKLSFDWIAYGMNADDTRDFRPANARQRSMRCWRRWLRRPDQLEVRALAKPLATRCGTPAAPCLSSRVEYGRTVTREVLDQVEEAKRACAIGFSRAARTPSWRVGPRRDARNELLAPYRWRCWTRLPPR